MVLSHGTVWSALDRLARNNGLSVSGLARKAGLDPTAFNRSKRVTANGRPRWPSTESLAKALAAVDVGLDDFAALVEERTTRPPSSISLIGCAQAGADGYFDDAGYPVGCGWDHIAFPGMSDSKAYALEVSGDSMEPTYRDGDRLIVSPDAALRRGDRVVLKTTDGEVMVKELARQTMGRIELRSLNPQYSDRTLPRERVEWIARVLWVSQ